MATLLVVMESKRTSSLLRWAKHLSATGGPPVVLCCSPNSGLAANEQRRSEEKIYSAVRRMMTARKGTFEVRKVSSDNPAQAILAEISAGQIEQLIIGFDGRLPVGSGQARLADRLMRTATCETLIIDPGESKGPSHNCVVVPMGGSLAGHALHRAAEIVGSTGRVMPLLVGSQFGIDSEVAARRELDMHLREAHADEITQQLEPTVALADQQVEGVLSAAGECDLVLTGGMSSRSIRELRKAATGPSRKFPQRLAIGTVRPAQAGGFAVLSRMRRKLRIWLPELSLTDRVALFDRVQAGSRINADFVLMTSLSTAIASLGLLQNSAAVVIGAMLVAPLMTPLIGCGMALVQGNLRLFRRSLITMCSGVLAGLVLSFFIGVITPRDELPLAVLERALPDLLDLMVAFVSGLAAAYAFSRTTLAEAIVGVAIAAALVPPLAVVGIGLSRGNIVIAEGAATLLITNLVLIILGAALVFRVLGVQRTRLGVKLAWVKKATAVLLLLSLLLLAPLGYNLANQRAVGQMRPFAFPVSKRVNRAINERVRREPGVSVIMAKRDGIPEARNFDLAILLAAEGEVSPQLVPDLEDIVHELHGREVDVEVWIVRSIAIPKTE